MSDAAVEGKFPTVRGSSKLSAVHVYHGDGRSVSQEVLGGSAAPEGVTSVVLTNVCFYSLCPDVWLVTVYVTISE